MPVLTALVEEHLLLVLALLFVIAVLRMVSTRLRISYPIVLVLGGLALSLVPGTPTVALDPELVFLLFLPPLLYEAAWSTRWRDFWRQRRPIALLAIGLVIATSGAVAFFAHAVIPGFTLAMGFLLGGIISPPDAVAATSVLDGLNVPKRVVTILEGESLVNDATSLIVFRFALAAIITGQFALGHAIGSFLLVAGLGVAIGVGAALVIYTVHRYLPTTPTIDVAITLMSPYIMYLLAESVHCSGVMAVVSGGLFLTYRSSDFMSYRTRIQGYAVWETITFMLNGFVFILIGLQLPMITSDLGMPPVPALVYALGISLITVVVRILWVFPGAYLPRMLSRRVRQREPRPSPAAVLLLAWAGMRGVVSLASALAIPLTLADGTAFPLRNFILFTTFVVILVTLVLQGLSLPWMIRALKFEEPVDEEATVRGQYMLEMRLSSAALEHLDSNYADEVARTESMKRIRAIYERTSLEDDAAMVEMRDPRERALFKRVQIELVHVRRAVLRKMRCDTEQDLELVEEAEEALDFEEARIDRLH